MAKMVIIIIVLAGLSFGVFWFLRPMHQSEFTKIMFNTSDGVTIVGNYYAPLKKPTKVVLMLHMMPAAKESWNTLASALKAHGIASLAIDLRGHGESVEVKNEKLLSSGARVLRRQSVKSLDYRKFNDEEYQASKLDVEAALAWLQQEKGFSLDSIDLIGASIGANLALQAQANHREIRKCVALSPGLNYWGIMPKTFVARLQANQEILYVTSQDDEDNTQMTQELYRASSGKKDIKIYEQAGHGTLMLERATDLQQTIINFLTQ